MKIVVDDLRGPEIAAFLEEHVAQMRSITPLESKHALDLDALRQPEITFWSVLDDDDTLIGCGAIKRLDDAHAELKSMRTKAERKRSGVASHLLEHILSEAREMGFIRISLETGSDEFFRDALQGDRLRGFVLDASKSFQCAFTVPGLSLSRCDSEKRVVQFVLAGNAFRGLEGFLHVAGPRLLVSDPAQGAVLAGVQHSATRV